MAEKHCMNCKNYVHAESFLLKEKIPHRCGIGNDDIFNKWWEDNGRKKYEDASETECYEQTETSKKLDEILRKMDELEKILDKKWK